jgi:hypothetical protein
LKESGFAEYIYSWDSSAAVWAGLNDVQFDRSPSGLIGGKLESEVDFNLSTASDAAMEKVRSNIAYINSLC